MQWTIIVTLMWILFFYVYNAVAFAPGQVFYGLMYLH